ncbi:biotin carboxylase N-terminal domain-containing protein [Phenylobacterium sp.]|uniref:acetyl-CoA carboxylase biotin carboxylase subunit n=1 Tax=Phenylobacterium sp. TaxID=1871053 RepID=UPI0025E0C330|nr:biotin carboxylase N-terminal domain-containing protein [Phenylobacterium sp.]MBX3484122.1 methylcrotonoyl-CoA carboxylase [Phenylobacterium sp.]
MARPLFRKVLIANRGEIACRVIRTCRRMGIATAAIYSDADARAQHVQAADEAIRIGEPPPRESYLSIERVVGAAIAAGADAVHPGYGFLSENADFAQACEAAGLTFIGPRPETIRQMALKDAGKRIARDAGVPVLGEGEPAESDAALLAAAEAVGFPVLIKAIAGGGGRGMRRADAADLFMAALAGARREALAAFGDDRVLVEKFLTRPRHIEVQVFGDGAGEVVHLFERDCSIQRRHQKVFEECPAPGLSPEMREAVTQAAVAVARRIAYRGAGTVEFIADVSEGLRADRFWFMEMNTRLQVEHPVTEAVLGVDLVEWQLRIAAGQPLPRRQSELALNGHALEARICAENPRKKYFPSPGRLSRVTFPSSGARVDTGVTAGDEVTPFYDSLLAKLIVSAPTRLEATEAMARALEACRIQGVATNLDLLHAVAIHPAFRAGDVDTSFLERFGEPLVAHARPAHDDALASTPSNPN